MASTQTASTTSLSANSGQELDRYASEFAKLVDNHTPSRHETPSAWLRRLPDEAFSYYQKGISTFGSGARTPIERRGRLYLIHTALLFMWMSGGKTAARQRFHSHADRGTRHAASLVALEHDRRAGILADFETEDWFSQPVEDWAVTLISGAVDPDALSNTALIKALHQQTTVRCTVGTLSKLRAAGAIPGRDTRSAE